MSSSIILPEDLKQSLKNTKIKKHDYSMIWLHWFNAFVWLILLFTGAGLISADKYRFIPTSLQNIIISIFGTKAAMINFHIWVGCTWIIVYLIYFAGSKRYFPVIKSVLTLDIDDFWWLVKKGPEMIGKKVQMPPQGFFNGGQKLFAIMVYLYTPVIVITGLIMSFQLFSPEIIRWSILFHYLSVAIVFIGLPVHMFMAGFYAPEREDFVSMFTGHISEWFAFNHNYKWWIKQKSKNALEVEKIINHNN